MRIVVLCPHFAPDIAPTGEVMTRIVTELAARGHELHVVTALPWYRSHGLEEGWGGRPWRVERTEWGSITRVHPFPADGKARIARRALGFVLFSVLVGVRGLVAGGWPRRVDAVLAMSPPLTLGITGWLVARARGARLTFNVQDVFPDAAVRTGAIRSRPVIRLASFLERVTYRLSAHVVVLSDDLAANVSAKLSPSGRGRVRVIPNFVDTDEIRPLDRHTAYRTELGIGDGPVVMYAGNLGFSQSVDVLIEAARSLPDVTVIVNGDGSNRARLEAAAAAVTNVRFVDYQPRARLGEVLASADVHVVPLRAGLANVSVPSKTYTILAAARPMVASIDANSEVTRILADSGAGVAVAPDDATALAGAIRRVLDDAVEAAEMGRRGRAWVERNAAPSAVAAAYEAILRAEG